jgi:hypothetical protein
VDVVARIDELAALYLDRPPTLSPAVELGVRVLVERLDRFPLAETPDAEPGGGH